jgi:hypothetical protein
VANPQVTQSLLESIPPPDLIRDCLARLFAEARLLRGLLRLSESKSRCFATDDQAKRREVKSCRD